MDRRKFLQSSGFAFGAAALPELASAEQQPFELGSWSDVRSQFELTHDKIHMAQMFLAAHPLPVREAIELHRKKFDENAVGYWEDTSAKTDVGVQESAAKYMGVETAEVALTDSTSMGLSLLYNGLLLKPGDEVLTSTHDHYATEMTLDFLAKRTGVTIRRITLYKDPSNVSIDEVVTSVSQNIQPATRVVALTWVHSGTGVKLPIRAIADAVAKVNAKRTAGERICFCVDGVHGFGVENVSMHDLGCDFFAAGTHKWIFGPRGTGVLYGRRDAHDKVVPVIPSFNRSCYGAWLGFNTPDKLTFGELNTAGGFHPFEHRWALPAAFDFQLKIGKANVQERTHQLSTQLKQGLLSIRHVKLHTPVSPELSAGINCFEVQGMSADEVVRKLHEKNIIGSASPYKTSYARLTPSIVNNEEEVATCIRAIENIKS